MLEIKSLLVEREDVTSATSTTWMAGPRSGWGEAVEVTIEWYASAEFSDGRALDFGFELSWQEGEWLIESRVTQNHAQGQDEVLGFPTRNAVGTADLIAELRSQLRLLR